MGPSHGFPGILFRSRPVGCPAKQKKSTTGIKVGCFDGFARFPHTEKITPSFSLAHRKVLLQHDSQPYC